MNIFTSLFPHLLKTPQHWKHSSLKQIVWNGNTRKFENYKNTHQRSYLKLWIRETLLKTYLQRDKHIVQWSNLKHCQKKYIKMDKDIIILQNSTKTHIWYIKTKPHGQSHTVSNRSAHQIRTSPVPTVGDGNVSRGTGAAQTTIEIFTFANWDPHANRHYLHQPY